MLGRTNSPASNLELVADMQPSPPDDPFSRRPALDGDSLPDSGGYGTAVAAGLAGHLRELEEQNRGLRDALAKQEALLGLYSGLHESSLVGCLLLDPEGIIQTANAAAASVVGFEAVALAGRSFASLVVEPERALFAALVADVLGDGVLRACEMSLTRRDRPAGLFRLEVSRPSGGGGCRVWLVDAADRRMAGEELEAREKRLGLLVASTSVVVYTCAVSGDFGATYVSDNVESILGYRPEQFTEDPAFWIGNVHPNDVDGVLAGLSRSLGQGEHEHQYRFRHRDGTFRWMHDRVRLMPAADGQPPMLIGSWADVTARRQAEEALKESDDRFSTIFRSAPGAMALFSMPDGKAVEVNDRFTLITGFSREEMLGKTTGELGMWTVPGERDRFLELLSRTGRVVDFEADLNHKSGMVRHGEVSGHLIAIRGASYLLGIFHDITVRRHAEEEVQRSFSTLQLFIDSVPHFIAFVDAEQRYRLVNRRYEEWFQRPRGEIIGRTLLELHRPETYATMLPHIRELMAGRPTGFENWMVGRDGRENCFDVRYVPRRSLDGSVLGYFVLVLDVTEHRQTEAALRESEGNYRTLVDSASDGILVVGEGRRVLEVNAACCRMFGRTRGEMLAMTIAELVAPAELPRVGPEIARLTAGGFLRSEWQFLHRDGKPFPCEASATVLADGRLLAIVRDITEQKRAVDALRESRNQLEKAQRVGGIGSWVSDPDFVGRLEWSAETCRIFGFEACEFDGRVETFVAHLHPDDRKAVEDAVAAALSGQGVYDLEHRIIRRDGEVRWVREQADVERDASGRPVRIIGVVREITERKLLEEQLRQAQKMEAIGQLAGGVAHDFNNLLAVMIMESDMIGQTPGVPDEVREGVDQIRRTAERAADLTRQLLLFSRRQVMQPVDLDLNEAVRGVGKMLQRIIGEDVDLQIDLHPQPLLIRADPGMLDQILLNLAVNARDAMPRGGFLTIGTSEFEVRSGEAASIQGATPGRHVRLRVTDTGVGIPPQNLSRIFEPFFTTKEPGKGTGLGLATVFGIVQQHGGIVSVESRVGAGSVFQILLPAIRPARMPTRFDATASSSGGGAETILVVEDEPVLRRVTRLVLERAGYNVLEAADGVQALKIWEQNREAIALLLTDIVMPEGISGRELADRIRAIDPRMRVVFTSGFSEEIAGREMRLKAGQNFIPKPASAAQMLETVRNVLDSRA